MLDTLKNDYEDYLNANQFVGNPARLYDSMNYIMQLGGKRIRPILTILGAEICGGSRQKALPVAHAIEVFHNFTLVHDDIMDEAPTRRSQPSLHLKENMATAILAGDNMMITAYDLIMQSDIEEKLPILKIFSQTAREICEGQQMDMDFEKEEHVGLERYLEMIRLKTAVLLGCCLKCGSLVAEAKSDIAQKLYEFGVNIGIAFQIMDDLLDAFGNPEITGKQPGGDILAGKKTALFNLAMQDGNSENIQNLKLWFDKSKTSSDVRLQHTMNLFTELGVAQKANKLMQFYFDKANLALEGLENINTNPLLLLIEFLKNRTK
jgi:geranylgeranyl diphosphate synthase type II